MADELDHPGDEYDSGFVVASEGSGKFMAMTCLRCGAAVLTHEVQDGPDPPQLHNDWHAQVEDPKRAAEGRIIHE